MENKPLTRISFIIFSLLCSAFAAQAQGGSKFVFYAGLPLHTQPMFDAGIQLKHYWVFDTALSNNGPGVGCEINFGANNSGITFGPKVYYQLDVYLGSLGHKKKSSLYVLTRIAGIRYTNSYGNDYRIAPEGGIALFDEVSLMYGYNFPIPFNGKNKIPGVFDNCFTLAITLGGKKK